MMNADFTLLTHKWCNLSQAAKFVIITDHESYTLASDIKNDIQNSCEIYLFGGNNNILSVFSKLSPSDLLVALFQFDTFVFGGANKIFSPFSKPVGLKAKYAFIRLSISKESLIQGLSTPKELVYKKLEEFNQYEANDLLQVTSAAGTDITLQVMPFETCCHEIINDGDMAFSPPSETSSVVIPRTANGRIAVDITVGQLYHYGDFLGYFGRVSSPAVLSVKDGMITDISGNDMVEELKEKLFALPPACRELVELGQGLSKMEPTGLIGVDESIIDSCHFGIGDGGKCGVHLDVVIGDPTIQIVSKER